MGPSLCCKGRRSRRPPRGLREIGKEVTPQRYPLVFGWEGRVECSHQFHTEADPRACLDCRRVGPFSFPVARPAVLIPAPCCVLQFGAR